MKKGSSRQRTQASRGLLVSKADADKAVVLANAPKPVKDALEKSCQDKQKAEKEVAKEKTRYERFLAASKRAYNDETKIEVVGGLAGQGWNEGLNYFIRWMAEWSQKTEGDEGWWASNVDLAQSFPGALAGLLYVLERLLRDDFNPEDKDLPADQRRPFEPSFSRRTVSEALKIAAHLGFSNTVRALRFRWAESIDEKKEAERALKDKDRQLQEARDELERAKAQVRALEARSGGATP